MVNGQRFLLFYSLVSYPCPTNLNTKKLSPVVTILSIKIQILPFFTFKKCISHSDIKLILSQLRLKKVLYKIRKKRDTNTRFNSIDYVEESFSTTPKNILRKALIISSYTPGFELKMFYAIEWIVLVVLTWKLINFMTYRFSIKNF